MTRFLFVFVIIACLILPVGCRKSTPTNPETVLNTPTDAEEAALQEVGNLYGFYATYHKKGPTGWEDLKAQASKANADTKQKALDAIEAVQAAGFKMKWGVDLPLMEKEGKKPNEYVIAESPDGRRKLMFSGNVETTKAAE